MKLVPIKAPTPELMRASLAEIEAAAGYAIFRIQVDLPSLLAIIAHLHLAMRHPAMDSHKFAGLVRKTVDGMVGQVRQAGFKASAQLIELGDNPEYDVPSDAAPTPELMRASLAEMEAAAGNAIFRIQVDLPSLLAIIAHLHLAMRHPAMDSHKFAGLVRKTVDGMVGQVRQAGFKASAQLIELGDNPEYDVPSSKCVEPA